MPTNFYQALKKANRPADAAKNTERQLSPFQNEQIGNFKKMFPFEENVLGFFTPAKWAAALQHADKCLLFPSITLSMLDSMYRQPFATQMVFNNLVGLFTIAKPRESIAEQSCQLAASLFVARLGTEISVFAMLHYFASYLMDYKNSFSQLDLQDVLRQCANAYLPQWRKRLSAEEHKRAQQQQECKTCGKDVGITALYSYLRKEYVEKGLDVRETPFYHFGRLTDEEVKLIESGEPLPL